MIKNFLKRTFLRYCLYFLFFTYVKIVFHSMIAAQVSSCSLGIPCIYNIQIKGCSKCRNINYRIHSLGSFISDLLFATFVLSLCICACGVFFVYFVLFSPIIAMSSLEIVFHIYNKILFVII